MTPGDRAQLEVDLAAFAELAPTLGRNAVHEMPLDVAQDCMDAARREYPAAFADQEVEPPDPKRKRKPSVTPTQRCMSELKRRGWTAAIAEKWVRFPPPGHHVDLFGVIDIVAIAPPSDELLGAGAIIGIQASPGTRHAAHRDKILAEPRARLWVEAGGRLELWSWSKRGDRGKRKLWTLRVEAFTADSPWMQP